MSEEYPAPSDAATSSADDADVPEAVRSGWRPSVKHIVMSALSLVLAAVLVVVVVPRAAGANWSDSFAVLGQLSVKDIILMTLFWALGLWMYTFVYTGSLPGLTHSKGLALNLTGSLVSNLLPFGGAAGVATTYGLTYAWGFSGLATSLMILVSGLANFLIRLLLPVVGLVALFFTGVKLSGAGGDVALGTLGGLAVITMALILMLFSSTVAALLGSLGDLLVRGLCRVLRRPTPKQSLRDGAVKMQGTAVVVIRRGWPSIAFGMCAYYGSEIILFGIALHGLGSDIGWAGVVAAFALSRLLTAVVVTPSGVGISEAGTAGALVLFGVPPAIATAAVIVLLVYTYLIELPTGAAGWIWVIAMRKRWFKRGFHRAQSSPQE
ncbi:MAG: lysylphosphatidylglycerol synthase transmembrane domain-containing protein [Actinomycetes bacterium]